MYHFVNWQFLDPKRTIQILRELFAGDRCTHELLEALPGISSKTLTVRLRELEAYGTIERRVYAEIPPRVEYSLTDKGRELQAVLKALLQLGAKWLDRKRCDCPLDAPPVKTINSDRESVAIGQR